MRAPVLVILLATLALPAPPAAAQATPDRSDWRSYGADLANSRYSPLDQVTADNFNRLEVAWRFRTDALGPRPEVNLQVTPLMVDGIVYAVGGTRRAAFALDAATGELLWMHSINEGRRGEEAPRRLSGRGLSYWTDGKESRIIYVTPGYQMVALDAKTGERVRSFGTNGIVDLKTGLDQDIDLVSGEIGLHAAPIIAKDVIVIGAAHLAGQRPKTSKNVRGYVRGFDVRTGKRLWIFHTIPLGGEFGAETWKNESWRVNGNTGSWAQMSADEELGLVYVPVEIPTGDYYGGHRPGNGLFGESLLALDVRTGKRRWHYQTVHHGVWDWDLPAAPMLIDITVAGRPVKAVAVPTKQSWLFVFDRVTGEPVWPIEERSVPAGSVPGEEYSPTQPHPTRPAAFDRQGLTKDDLIDFTPELRTMAERLIENYEYGPMYTPPVLSRWPRPLGTIFVPHILGGSNWPGGSWDPETRTLFVYSMSSANAIGLVEPPPGTSDMRYIVGVASDPNPPASTPSSRPAPPAGEGGGGLSVDGLPLLKPPYARITAIDMNRGELLWQIPHGDTPDAIRNHPRLKGLELPRTGRQGRIGTLTTRTLLIAGEAGTATTPDGRGAYLRAYDKRTGADAGKVFMPAGQTGSPMTYMWQGRQYIVLAIGGPNATSELVAFALPANRRAPGD